MHFPIHFGRRAHEYPVTLRLRDTRARAVRNILGNVYLSSLTKNLWYELVSRGQTHTEGRVWSSYNDTLVLRRLVSTDRSSSTC